MAQNQLCNPTAMRRQSPYNTHSSWHSSQSIWYQAGSCGSHLKPSVWTLPSGIFCIVLPRTTFQRPWFHGDTECSKQILEGSYEYPPKTNVWTNKILQAAHYTFSHMSGAKIVTTISTMDFQQYWIKVDKWTSSSFSGVTFLHYKVAASHSMLSAMHAAYLSACAWKGIPLAHWGMGLTVLLEKISDINFVHKLRAICFLEADFNWINKVLFAKWMIGSALERNSIPGECFSRKGSKCINAIMIKIFICNESRIHHHDTCIASNNFRDCYDRAAHPFKVLGFPNQ